MRAIVAEGHWIQMRCEHAQTQARLCSLQPPAESNFQSLELWFLKDKELRTKWIVLGRSYHVKAPSGSMLLTSIKVKMQSWWWLRKVGAHLQELNSCWVEYKEQDNPGEGRPYKRCTWGGMQPGEERLPSTQQIMVVQTRTPQIIWSVSSAARTDYSTGKGRRDQLQSLWRSVRDSKRIQRTAAANRTTVHAVLSAGLHTLLQSKKAKPSQKIGKHN